MGEASGRPQGDGTYVDKAAQPAAGDAGHPLRG